MAFNMKLQVASVLIVSVMFVLYSAHGVSCQEGESSADKKPLEPISELNSKIPQLAGLPVIVVRQQSGTGSGSSSGSGSGSSTKPDIYLGWLNWDGLSFLKPFSGPFTQAVSPFSQQISSMLLSNVPGASTIYSQFDTIGNQISSMNPFSQIMGQLSGGSSSSSGSTSASGSTSGSGSGLSGLPGLSGFGNLFQGRR